MRARSFLLPLAFAATALLGARCASTARSRPADPAAGDRELVLLFTGDGWGELEPCG